VEPIIPVVDESKLPELTSEEKAEAILQKRIEKQKAIELEQTKKEYWNKITSAPVRPTVTAELLRNRLAASANAKGERFVIDDENKSVVATLCLYFSNDPRLLEYGFRHDKGILLLGPLGVGKSHLMSFFIWNKKASYVMTQCAKVEERWNKSTAEDEDVIGYYSGTVPYAINVDPFGHQKGGFCFDELGVETIPSVRFGEKKNVMEQVILSRYANPALPHSFTHYTTNLNEDQITEKYGDRVMDRLKEMCNIVVFPTEAKSRRK
jgi:DNA replication protein DnaC